MKEVKEKKEGGAPTLFERSIWKGYGWAAMIVPLLLMLSHWGIFYLFSLNQHEVMNYPEANEICIAWLFFIVFCLVPAAFLPATYLYRRCNLFRIPFLYFIFINVERAYFGAYFCTNEMVDTHYILIYCIITLYVFELAELAFRHMRGVIVFFRRIGYVIGYYFKSTAKWLGEATTCEDELTDGEIDKIIDTVRKLDKKEGRP